MPNMLTIRQVVERLKADGLPLSEYALRLLVKRGAIPVRYVNIASDIIDYRYTKRLTTIISTERSPAELVDIDEATGGRIYQMAQCHTYFIEKKPGRNYRLRCVVTV